MELADNSNLSDFTKRTLAQFGWVDSDPIPADLGALLMRLKDNSPRSSRTDVLIDINVLASEGIAEIKEMLAAGKIAGEALKKEQAREEKLSKLSPAAAAAYRSFEAQEAAQAQIIDDRQDTPAPAPTPDATPAAAPETEPDEIMTPLDPAPPPMVMLPFCQRCGYDNRQKFDIQVTDLDKQDFLAAVLGNKRFKRDFELMGGNLVLTFRTPLADENKLLHRQLVFDQHAGRVVTEAEWFTQMIEYRMAVSLDKISDKNGKILSVVPEMSEFKYTPPPDEPLQTPLVAMLAYVNTTVLAHEVIRRLAGQHLRHFQRVVEALEAMALEPSFWHGIA